MRISHSSTGSLRFYGYELNEEEEESGEFARHGPVCTVAAVSTLGGVVAHEAPRVSSTPH